MLFKINSGWQALPISFDFPCYLRYLSQMSILVPRRYWAGNWESYQVAVHQQLSDVSDFDQSCGLWWEVADTDGEHVLEEGNTMLQNEILLIGIFRSSYDNVLIWMSWDLSEDKSTLVQVMQGSSQNILTA